MIVSSAPRTFCFPLLQLRRRKSFGVGERLPAFVIVGDCERLPFRDLNVIAKDVVESDFEIRDAGPRPFLFLETPRWFVYRSWKYLASRQAPRLNPSRIVPPSPIFIGGSSAIARSIRSRISGSSKMFSSRT